MKKLLLLLLLAGCGQVEYRHTIYMPIAKERRCMNSAYWDVLIEDAKGNQFSMEVWNDDALRVVPGVPISICEVLDNGKIIDRRIAKRID